MIKNIVCFGEALIDVYEDFEVVAGAPLHVASILSTLGNKVYLCTSVGNDKNGKKIINYLLSKKINTKYVKIDNKLSTGLSKIKFTKNNSTNFILDTYCAWDEITIYPKLNNYFLYLGSVATRSLKSRNTLNKMLENKNQYIFFDPNLRKPNYNISILKKILLNSNFIKITYNEMKLLTKILKIKINITQLFKLNKNLIYIFVTNGSKGSKIYSRRGLESNLVPKNKQKKIKYTVGSGDVFSAAIMHCISNDYSLIDMHHYAQNLSEKFLYKIGV